MTSGWPAALELLLVFGGVLALAVWELIGLRRERARDAAREAQLGDRAGSDRE